MLLRQMPIMFLRTAQAQHFIFARICSAAVLVIGVKPPAEYQFRVFTTPVGPYFKGGAKPITIKVSDFDRAAPHGTGHIKAGLNYAMSLHAIVTAHAEGFDENMYLDAATRTKVEETGGANFIFVTKDNKVVTPKSNKAFSPQLPAAHLCMLLSIILVLRLKKEKFTLMKLRTLQNAVFRYSCRNLTLSAKLTTTARKFVSRAVWMKWVRLQRSFTIHLQVFRWAESKLPKAGLRKSSNQLYTYNKTVCENRPSFICSF